MFDTSPGAAVELVERRSGEPIGPIVVDERTGDPLDPATTRVRLRR